MWTLFRAINVLFSFLISLSPVGFMSSLSSAHYNLYSSLNVMLLEIEDRLIRSQGLVYPVWHPSTLTHSPRNRCCGLNCASPKYVCWSFNLHVTMLEIGPLRRWLRLNEVERAKPRSDRTGALLEEEETIGLPLYAVRTQQEDGLLQARKKALTRTPPYWNPTSSFRTVGT